jgi:integrase
LDRYIAEAREIAASKAGGTATEMPHWTIHDLRSTFATRAADRLGIDIAVVDRMLNHVATATTSKIARIYNMSELFEPRRKASNAWAELLESEVIGNEPKNVL